MVMEDCNLSGPWTQPWKWGEDLIVMPNRKWDPDKDTAWAKHKCGAKKKNCLTAARVKNSNTYRGQEENKGGRKVLKPAAGAQGSGHLTHSLSAASAGWSPLSAPSHSGKAGFCHAAGGESHHQEMWSWCPQISQFSQRSQTLESLCKRSRFCCCWQ